MRAYSNDLRQKVIDAYEKGEESMRALAQRFSVSLNFVWLLIQGYRQTGRVDPKPHGGGQPRKLELDHEFVLEDLVKQHPVATLEELAQLLKDQTGLQVSASTIGLALRRRGITRKKVSYHASERDESEKIRQAREQFRQRQPKLDASQQIFIDEVGVNLGMARHYGRAPRGHRVEASKPADPGSNLSLIGALGLDGVRTIMLIEGAVNGEIFKLFLQQMLGPHLKPDDRVWMDNLKAHKVEGVAEAIEEKHAKAEYLPAYSPDFSPIELFWSKVKEFLRGAAARTLEDLEGAIRNALDEITQSDINGWFKHCGFCIETN